MNTNTTNTMTPITYTANALGNSGFESWYNSYNPMHKSDKHRARDAYAAGMGE